MEENNTKYPIERTKKSPKRCLVHTIIYGSMVAVFTVLCAVFRGQNYPIFLPIIMGVFLLLSCVLLGLSMRYQSAYKNAEKVHGKLTDDGIILNDNIIKYDSIKSVKASPCYEKYFFKLIGSNLSQYSFGTLKLVLENRTIKLYYIENVKELETKISEKIN